MKKYLLSAFAIILAFAFTTKEPGNSLSDFYYTDDQSVWIGASSIQDAKDQTNCDEDQSEFCANVYQRSHLIMSGETVLGVASQPGGGEYQPDVVLEFPE